MVPPVRGARPAVGPTLDPEAESQLVPQPTAKYHHSVMATIIEGLMANLENDALAWPSRSKPDWRLRPSRIFGCPTKPTSTSKRSARNSD
jgi:hypothetical protein